MVYASVNAQTSRCAHYVTKNTMRLQVGTEQARALYLSLIRFGTFYLTPPPSSLPPQLPQSGFCFYYDIVMF